jgi:DNA (cytosine-5)-methyltransferase 1
MPKAISLFTGCGGSDAGLHDAGFEVVMANDILPYARDLYAANMPETDFILGDVSEIQSFPAADLLVGCYPCQGFSVGGARQPDRKINFLYRQFDRALRQVKPKAFIVENVAGMVREDNLHLFNNQITRFRMAGYRVSAKVLDARTYGVAQERKRLFFVGIRSDLQVRYAFPAATHRLESGTENELPPCPTIRERIGDLPAEPLGEYDDQPFHWYYLSRDRYRRWDQQSKTIVATSRHAPLHPSSPPLIRLGTDKWRFAHAGRARRMSYRECARIQGFKQDLIFPESHGLRMRYRVIGNAVPPPLFAAVSRNLPDIW